MTETTIRILVVDDEELLRSSLGKFLERKGFQVGVAESGNKAFELLETESFDLILCDVRMPDGDGPSLINLINKRDGDKPVTMFMTGYSDLSNEELVATGALHVFDKPVDRQEILTKIKDHFQIS